MTEIYGHVDISVGNGREAAEITTWYAGHLQLIISLAVMLLIIQ